MQRTEHFTILHGAGSQRAASMRTLVIDAKELTANIPEGKFAAVNIHGATVPR